MKLHHLLVIFMLFIASEIGYIPNTLAPIVYMKESFIPMFCKTCILDIIKDFTVQGKKRVKMILDYSSWHTTVTLALGVKP